MVKIRLSNIRPSVTSVLTMGYEHLADFWSRVCLTCFPCSCCQTGRRAYIRCQFGRLVRLGDAPSLGRSLGGGTVQGFKQITLLDDPDDPAVLHLFHHRKHGQIAAGKDVEQLVEGYVGRYRG